MENEFLIVPIQSNITACTESLIAVYNNVFLTFLVRFRKGKYKREQKTTRQNHIYLGKIFKLRKELEKIKSKKQCIHHIKLIG